MASTEYSLTIDGTPVMVEKFADVSYARFAFTGSVTLVVTTSAPISDITVSPVGYGISPSVNGNKFSIALSQPRKLIVKIGSREKLFIFADPPETDAPSPAGAGVVNLSSYLSPGRNPATAVTAQFQSAINDTAASNGGAGGVLYVPSGRYMATQLKLKSNVQLYLESGALVQAVNAFNASNYPIQAGADSSFIYIGDASNVKISGRGMIDGNGYAIRTTNPNSGNLKVIRAKGASNLLLQDFYIRDSARWTVHILYSDYVNVNNLKLVNDVRQSGPGDNPLVSNTDAFDLDASTFVTVKNSFVHTQDDAFSPKVTNYMNVRKPAHDILVQGNVISTRKCAIRAGSESLENISNVTFDNNEVVYADRLLGIWNEGGKTISNFTVTNNRTETIGVNNIPQFVDMYIRVLPGYIDSIAINGLYATSQAQQSSSLQGYDSRHKITNFSISNAYIANQPVVALLNSLVRLVNTFVSNITVMRPGADGPPTVEVLASDDLAIRGEDSGTFTFSRAGATDAPLTIDFSVSGTATAGVDYPDIGNSVTIPAGANLASVTVAPTASAAGAIAETVKLNLTPDSSYRLGSASSDTVRIINSSVLPSVLPTVSLIATDPNAAEANADPGVFTVSRSGPTSAPLLVSLSLGGTATNGVDYMTLVPVVTIPAGASSATITVVPIADSLTEGTETVTLAIAPGSAYVLGVSTSDTVSIIDSPPALPSISLGVPDSLASESGGDSGLFTVSRSGSTSAPLTVYLAVGGTATNGSDYSTIAPSVIIPAGAASVNIVVTPIADSLIEGTETVVLALTPNAGYQLGAAISGTVSIADANTSLPAVSLVVADGSASEAPDNPGAFVVSRSGPTDAALSVSLTIGGTATNGVDYSSISSTAVIPAGASSVRITVSPLADTLKESTETVILSLAAGSAYRLGSAISGKVSIIDVPPVSVTVRATDAQATEAPGNTGQFTISRTGSTAAALAVSLSIGGSATNGIDYRPVGTSVTIPAGAASTTVTISPIQDSLRESTESVILFAIAGPGYILGSPNNGTVTIADSNH